MPYPMWKQLLETTQHKKWEASCPLNCQFALQESKFSWLVRKEICTNKHKHRDTNEKKYIVETKSNWPDTGWSAGAEQGEPEVEEPRLRQCQAARSCGRCQGGWSRERMMQASAAAPRPVGLALSGNFKEAFNDQPCKSHTFTYIYSLLHIMWLQLFGMSQYS